MGLSTADRPPAAAALNEVAPGLFLGGLAEAPLRLLSLLEDSDYAHLPPPAQGATGARLRAMLFPRLIGGKARQVAVADSPAADLLSELPRACAF
eukprot:gene45778-49925_t